MKESKINKKGLGMSISRVCVTFAIILSFLVGTLGFTIYVSRMFRHNKSYCEGILRYALLNLDGDDLALCAETLTPTPEYEKARQMLEDLRVSHSEVSSIYIVRPLKPKGNDNMLYLMDVEPEDERFGPTAWLGELSGNEYDERTTGFYIACMNGGDEAMDCINKTTYGYLYSVMMPVRNSAGEAVCVLAVDISIMQLLRTIAFYLVNGLLGNVLFIIGYQYMLYRWMKKHVITPVKSMEKSASEFVESCDSTDLPQQLHFVPPDIHTGDEMQSLSDTLCRMSDDVKKYMSNLMRQTKEKERIASELNVATQIQADMLPSIFPPFPDIPAFDLYAMMDPAKEVGGDFYDFFLVDDTHLAMVMADVSGKGVPAALFMVIAKTLLKNRAQTGGDPAAILHDVNNQLCEGNKTQMFVTVWLAIVDITTGHGLAANAGHEDPVVCRKNGEFELVRYRHSPALAVMEDMNFRQHEFELRPGDTLFVYTDGVPEATNAEEKMYGTERMLAALNSSAAKSGLKDMLVSVRKDINAFVDGAPQFDDITMLGMAYYGKEGRQE